MSLFREELNSDIFNLHVMKESIYIDSNFKNKFIRNEKWRIIMINCGKINLQNIVIYSKIGYVKDY